MNSIYTRTNCSFILNNAPQIQKRQERLQLHCVQVKAALHHRRFVVQLHAKSTTRVLGNDNRCCGNAPVFGIAEANAAEVVGQVAVTLTGAIIAGVTDVTEPARGTISIPLVGNALRPVDPRNMNPPPSMPFVLASRSHTRGSRAPTHSSAGSHHTRSCHTSSADAVVDVAVALLVVVAVELLAVLDAALDTDIPQSSNKSVRQASESWAHNLARCAGECQLEEQRSRKDNACFPLSNFGVEEENASDVTTPSVIEWL
ncbi:unnamed protein product [Phytophthora fragariaefolia]|uniref:Unnamed protein product n=1 Tax=Phytophthora fragariaefolia TaxID=1490495 RepID=A0A9W7CRQ7_9STRA|nr:unnamed protein product [Phytophthora fragariaefolia]